VIGETFSTFVSNAYPNAPVLLFCGSIPVSPRVLANGCTLFLAPPIRTFGSGVTSGTGTWVLNRTVPYFPALIGRELSLQAVVLGAPRYELTNALHLLTGL